MFLDRFRARVNATCGDVSLLLAVMVHQEGAFVKDLQAVNVRVWTPLQAAGILSSEALELIFGNWQDLLAFHCDLLARLTAADSAHSLVGLYSEAMRSLLELHEIYAENLTTGLARLELAKSKSMKLQKFLVGLRENAPRWLDITSLLIRPLGYMACLAESFCVLAGATCGVEDVGGLTSHAAVLFRMVAAPVEMVHDKLALTCSNAKLKQLELQLAGATDDSSVVDLIGNTGRMLIDETEVVLSETNTTTNARDIHNVILVLCSDLMIFLKVRGGGGSNGRLLIHDLVPLSLLQFSLAPSLDMLCFANKAKSGVSFGVHFLSAAQAKLWDRMLHTTADAAFAFYHNMTQAKEDMLGSSSASTSGWGLGVDDGLIEQAAGQTAPKSFVDTDDIQYTNPALTPR
jgi:hypothetical protein